MLVQSYLFFDGRCEEALGFYQRAVGAELLMLMRNQDSPEPLPPGSLPEGSGQKVLHASLRIGQSVVMASDGHNGGQENFKGFALSLSVADEAEAKRAFDALAEGGRVDLPLGRTFWSPCFGMLTDRFGVGWMIGLDGDAG